MKQNTEVVEKKLPVSTDEINGNKAQVENVKKLYQERNDKNEDMHEALKVLGQE